MSIIFGQEADETHCLGIPKCNPKERNLFMATSKQNRGMGSHFKNNS